MDKKQNDSELKIIEGLTTKFQYNSSDTASPLKLKFTIPNNTKEEFDFNNVTV